MLYKEPQLGFVGLNLVVILRYMQVDASPSQKKKVQQRRRGEAKSTPSHPMVAPFVTSLFAKTPLSPPLFPYIRSLVPNPVPSLVFFYDRTYTEWMTLIQSWRSTAACIEGAFFASQRKRFLARCYLRKLRMSLARRRCPPADDLFTCAPIPPSSRVTVYDFRHRSVHTFHWQTILKMCLTSLSFSQYGIAQPLTPKNPHTNLSWGVGQRVSVVHQIAVCSLNRHAFLPTALMWYRNAKYSVHDFLNTHYDSLQTWAAHSFFSRPAEPEVRLIYGEVVDGLYHDLWATQQIIRGGVLISERIKARTLPPSLQTQWDALVVSTWIMENHGRPHNGFRTHGEALVAADLLHKRSWAWLIESRRAQGASPQGASPPLNPQGGNQGASPLGS